MRFWVFDLHMARDWSGCLSVVHLPTVLGLVDLDAGDSHRGKETKSMNSYQYRGYER